MSARAKLPPELADLLRSELETAIREAALHRDDELIARRYIVEKWAQMDIAVELGWDRSTVSHHLAYIIEEVKRVVGRLNMRKGASQMLAPFLLCIFDHNYLFRFTSK